jgi:hypothetical protein
MVSGPTGRHDSVAHFPRPHYTQQSTICPKKQERPIQLGNYLAIFDRVLMRHTRFPSKVPLSVHAADGGPGIDADRGRELLQLEPSACLVCVDLEGYSLAQDVYGELEVFEARRA